MHSYALAPNCHRSHSSFLPLQEGASHRSVQPHASAQMNWRVGFRFPRSIPLIYSWVNPRRPPNCWDKSIVRRCCRTTSSNVSSGRNGLSFCFRDMDIPPIIQENRKRVSAVRPAQTPTLVSLSARPRFSRGRFLKLADVDFSTGIYSPPSEAGRFPCAFSAGIARFEGGGFHR